MKSAPPFPRLFPDMRQRKTIEIETIKEKANAFFANSDDSCADARRALQGFVSNILMDSGNYKGYNYLGEADVKPGFSFGKSWTDNGVVFHDESRIFFF